MKNEYKSQLLSLLDTYNKLRIAEQVDYEKFYLYSIITHSTAIEGSTVTEVEAQLLFDEGITSGKRTMVEQMMNLDLKSAYEYGISWIKSHRPITAEWLISLASKVMEHTGSEYHTALGDFSAAKGELRRLNVTAGIGGRSYLSFQKVPGRLYKFCEELNKRRANTNSEDAVAVYDLSFWAHYELVTIHPWADGNGRTSRLLMNLIQMEFGFLPMKVLKEDRATYIQSLADASEKDDINIFLDCMIRLHIRHLKADIEQYKAMQSAEVVDKTTLIKEMVGKWSIKPSLAEKLADIIVYCSDTDAVTTEGIVREFGFPATSAKRYLRQLCRFGYIEAHGGNKNRTYSIATHKREN